ncbi:ImmA/IrrE family metallo-endopeptidase [Paraburkholderia sp. Ac-20340]|uniref:XRE family transcriptional regulator n=1 Tax=Paraburkholderia sp. Ac-20340 TaxID=2703888 RepID=UPI00198119FB|nr:XRE family transcriptional regulator [Paraburkholderia sp. Ac-20340]MBN3854601.1 ImmA/IrrE family metallo-endopeptidase [Paraburkholderia sp. Ac-20340]
MAEAQINPTILTWALQRAGIDAHLLAEKLGTASTRVNSWESGERKPTFRQAQRIAEITHIPFGYLYLQQPPEEILPIADFRTIGNDPVPPLGADFRDLLDEVLRKQAWFREYRQQHGHQQLEFIGRFNVRNAAADIAVDIGHVLKITPQDRLKCQNWEEYLRLLIERIESVGILVMRSGIVGNNTHRPLSVDEFRGFVVADIYAPVIFLNGKDAKAAQIFTVIHELAHLWIGESGVSNEQFDAPYEHDRDIERLCNATAAEFLVPANELRARWRDRLDFAAQVRELARAFKVSGVVVGRRAVELRLAPWDAFSTFYQVERAAWAATAARQAGGGNPYRTAASRNGKLLTKAVLETAFEGRMLLREAGSLLGVAPANLKKLASSLYGEE